MEVFGVVRRDHRRGLRDTVPGWDAMYVALAEILDAVLITTDRRLAAARGPACRIDAL